MTASVDGGRIIRLVRMASGEMIPLLVEPDGIPTVTLAGYMLELRGQNLAHGTLLGHLQGIRRGLALLESRGIDMIECLATGRFLDNGELEALGRACRTRLSGTGAINGDAAGAYYDAIIAFLLWRLGPILRRASASGRKELRDERARFEVRSKKYRPAAEPNSISGERQGLNPTLRDRLFEIIKPSTQSNRNPLNPFYPKFQIRNRAIIATSYLLGFRSGEMLGFIRDDYDRKSTPATLTVHRRPDNPQDRRREPAMAKTLPRMLELDCDTTAAMDAWLELRRDRGLFPAARTHGYIFVASTGEQLSPRAFRGIFERLRSVHPEFASFCNHVLRHDMNERAVERAGEDGICDATLRDDLLYINGWSSESRMPARYAKRAIAKRANKRISTRQRRLLKPSEYSA